MDIEPINGRVLVKPAEPAEKTAGRVFLPDTARGGSTVEGEVVVVAEDATDEVVVGDRVIYRELAGSEITSEGEKYVLLPPDDLLLKYLEVDKIPE